MIAVMVCTLDTVRTADIKKHHHYSHSTDTHSANKTTAISDEERI